MYSNSCGATFRSADKVDIYKDKQLGGPIHSVGTDRNFKQPPPPPPSLVTM